MTDTAGTLDRTHPVDAALSSISAQLDAVADVVLWSLDDAETRDLLTRLTATGARLAELEARVAAHADSVGAGEAAGATSLANWWAHATRLDRPETHRRTRLAAGLSAHEQCRAAMAAGRVLPEQARVIIRAVEVLPADPELRRRAEAYLLEQAAHFDAKHLRILGRRVLDVVDPAAAEAHEAEQLEKEERNAQRTSSFTMSRDGHGKAHGRFTVPEAQAAMLEKALRAIAAPKHHRAVHGAGSYDLKPSPERMGQAFCEYIERYPTDGLPESGGVTATVVVTMTLETLLGGLAAAALDTGEVISPAQARRIACEAGIIPVVLDGTSTPLDVGRERRLFTRAQRLALGLTQRHCQHPTCDAPAARCHAHHTHPWSKGGRTDLANAQLLCPRHHTLAHRTPDPPMQT